MGKFRSNPEPDSVPDDRPVFIAKYDGRCTNCDEDIDAGFSTIRSDGDFGYEHAGEDEC